MTRRLRAFLRPGRVPWLLGLLLGVSPSVALAQSSTAGTPWGENTDPGRGGELRVVPPPVRPALSAGMASPYDAALVVGNEDYLVLPDVPYANDDANAFREMLVETVGIPSFRVRFLAEAKRDDVLKSLQGAAAKVKKGGTLWVYFSGHGYLLPESSRRVILCRDAALTADRLPKTSITLDDLVSAASNSQASRIIFVLDAGFNGLGRDGVSLGDAQDMKVPGFPEFAKDNLVIWAANEGATTAESWPYTKHGTFTYLVLGALRGWADGSRGDPFDGTVTLGEAQAWVDETLYRLNRRQTPTRDLRPAVRDWELVMGALEKGPTNQDWHTMARQEREDSMIEAETHLRKEVADEWKKIQAQVEAETPEGREGLETFLDTYARSTLTYTWTPFLPEAQDGRKALDNWGRRAEDARRAEADKAAADKAAADKAATDKAAADKAAAEKAAAEKAAAEKAAAEKAAADKAAADKAAADKAAADAAARKAKEEEDARKAAEVVAAQQRAVEEAARKAAEAAALKKKQEEEAARKAAEAAAKQAASKPLDDSCTDLIKLEEPAFTGSFRPGQIACLEKRFAKEKKMTTKDKISRLLLVDAEGKGDKVRWEELVVRHLELIDQSDPDLCFKYAVFLSKGGLANAEKVIKWSNRAMENKHRWQGDEYKRKVFLISRLRAEAAADLWTAAEEQYLVDRTPQAEDQANLFRGQAKEAARAWLEYARVSNQDTRTALDLCMAAAGAAEYCLEEQVQPETVDKKK